MVLWLPDALVLDDRLVNGTALLVQSGRIADIGPAHQFPGVPERPLTGTLLPGVVDLQVNGAGGRGVDEATPEALDHIATAVLSGGATYFLPTLISAPFERLLQQVRAVVAWIRDNPGKGALGLHVEGPFLEVPGAHPANALVDPSPERIEALLEAAGDELRLVTLAPGLAGAVQACARLTEAGVLVSLGHAADARQVGACVDAGARMVTHLFNAMSPLHHREPGLVGAALDDGRLTSSLIPDGHHVGPAAMRLAWRVLGRERLVLVTDSASPAGAPDGDYRLGEARVRLANGIVRDDDGRLAGSALLAGDGLRGFRAAVPGADEVDLAFIMATNPAKLIGAPARIEVGAPARCSLLGPDGSLSAIVD
jgi:N-acetylglucosamine-6-phosphate deacetylase